MSPSCDARGWTAGLCTHQLYYTVYGLQGRAITNLPPGLGGCCSGQNRRAGAELCTWFFSASSGGLSPALLALPVPRLPQQPYHTKQGCHGLLRLLVWAPPFLTVLNLPPFSLYGQAPWSGAPRLASVPVNLFVFDPTENPREGQHTSPTSCYTPL